MTQVVVTGKNIDLQGIDEPTKEEIIRELEQARLSITSMLIRLKGPGIKGSEIDIKKT